MLIIDTILILCYIIIVNIIDIRNIDSREKINQFAASVYNWFIKECINHNQYMEFTESQINTLIKLYKTLIQKLREIPPQSINMHIEKTVKIHRNKLLKILQEIFSDQKEIGQKKLCSEYSYELQKQILRLELNTLLEPILDIGCGKEAFFVKECMFSKKEVFGIDLYKIQESNNIFCKNWLEYDYKRKTWGSIVSHMAFSNHFNYHIANRTKYYTHYNEKYIEIINCLKIGGSFYYSPSLPKIEQNIDKRKYELNYFDNIVNENNIRSVRIKRIA